MEKPIVLASYIWQTILQTLICQKRSATQRKPVLVWILVWKEDSTEQAQMTDAGGHTSKTPHTMSAPQFPSFQMQSLLGLKNRNCDHISDVSI